MDVSNRRPWSFIAGAVLATFGLGVLLSSLGGGFPIWATVTALGLGAVVELLAGFELRREGGAWIAQVVSGGTMLFLGLFMLGMPPLLHTVIAPPSVAMMLGIYCLANGLFRGADIWADHPRAAVAEAVNTVLTLALSVALVHYWRDVALWQLTLAAGSVLLTAGAAVADAAQGAYRHPELSAYDDLAAAVASIEDLEAKVEGYDHETDQAARHDVLPSH